jgi:beta-lactamase class A
MGAEGDALAAIEQRYGGRLGVSIINTQNGNRLSHRSEERFPLCSTFKLLAVALVLKRVDDRQDSLDRRIVYSKESLVTYSPVTEKHVEDGMTLSELCEAALTLSDNTAGNLILETFGGPAALTAYARSIGDAHSRLDRNETSLNEATPGDPRDTTTPSAMLHNLDKIVLGDALSRTSRDQLIRWFVANRTGDKRLRAGLPKDWRVGDKTGSGSNGTANDIAVVWPKDRAPLLISAYYTQSVATAEERNSVLAEVGRIAAAV